MAEASSSSFQDTSTLQKCCVTKASVAILFVSAIFFYNGYGLEWANSYLKSSPGDNYKNGFSSFLERQPQESIGLFDRCAASSKDTCTLFSAFDFFHQDGPGFNYMTQLDTMGLQERSLREIHVLQCHPRNDTVKTEESRSNQTDTRSIQWQPPHEWPMP